MANYNSNKALPGVTPKFVHNGDLAVLATYTFPTGTQLNANDTIAMMTIPQGCYITGVTLDVDKLDGGGAPAIKLNVGDAALPNRFINQSTAGQAGGYQVPNVNGGMGFQYAANTQVLITVQTGAAGATTAPAVARLIVNYTIDP